MKKKILLLFLLLLSASTYAEWQGIIIGTRISMYVSFNHDEAIKGNMPQSPAPTQIPTVSIDGRTLYFYDVFSIAAASSSLFLPPTQSETSRDVQDGGLLLGRRRCRSSAFHIHAYLLLYTCAWLQ